MRVAEVLSDLISLRACDAAAAQALVSARPAPQASGDEKTPSTEAKEDIDLERAKNLIKLHYSMKVPQSTGQVNAGLLEARRVVKELNIA